MADNSVLVPYQNATHAFGEFVGDTAKAIANAAGDAVCGLYQSNPGFATGSDFNNPIASYNDGLLDSLCRPRGKLPANPPQVPFNGGQCVCVDYLVSFTYTISGGSPQNNQVVVPGPIGTVFKTIRDQSGTPVLYDFGCFVGSAACGGQRKQNLLSNVTGDSTCNITSVVRNDSQPDTCGNPPPTYPIVQPTNNQTNFNTNIQVSPTTTINAPVSIFAPVESFSPSLSLGPFNVDLNLGGLNISFNPSISPSGNGGKPYTPPQPLPGNKPEDRDNTDLLNKILRYLKYQRQCDPTDCDYDFHTTGIVSGNSGMIPLPSGGIPLAVALSLTVSPSNKKFEYGAGQPDVVYAGWSWWGGNNNLSLRTPIDADNKLYHPPVNPSPDSFHWTCRQGFQAQAVMSYKTLKNPLPEI